MTALLAGLIGVGSFALGIRGWVLARSHGVARVDDELAAVLTRDRTSFLERWLGLLDRLVGRRALRQVTGGSLERADKALALAAYPGGFTAERLIARQASWAFLGFLVALLLLASGEFFGLLFIPAGWYLPRLLVWLEGRKRTAALERELPDFLDVLVVTITAGLGFRAALHRVASAVEGPVGEEMLIALRQMDLGSSRRTAFVALRERTASASLSNFVTAFLQSEELGAPLSQFMTNYAAELRRTAGQRARAAASRANPKISLAITLIIVPAITLFLLGSLVLNAYQEVS